MIGPGTDRRIMVAVKPIDCIRHERPTAEAA